MKKCKYCQTEIDSKAKICPNCRKKVGGMPTVLKVLIIIAFIFFIIILMIGSCAKSVSDAINEVNDNSDLTYTITNQYDDTFSYYVEGNVKNNGSKNYSYVSIEFVCYDSNGNNIGTALDSTTNLLAKESWKFKAMLLSSNDDVDHCNYHNITRW